MKCKSTETIALSCCEEKNNLTLPMLKKILSNFDVKKEDLSLMEKMFKQSSCHIESEIYGCQILKQRLNVCFKSDSMDCKFTYDD